MADQFQSTMLASALVPDILNSAPDAMIVVDMRGVIIFANRQVAALFGYSQAEVIGTRIEQLLPERFRASHVTHRQQYTQHARVRPMGIGLDLWARRRDGSEFPVEISLSPIRTGEGPLTVAAIRDVSEGRQVQMELRRAREGAEQANRAKSRFLATASHDLRQPLQSLALLNGAMRRLTADPALAEPLAQQAVAIDSMSRLLNALLDISKLESGAIKPEITDFKVAKLFAQLRAEFTELAEGKGLELRVEACDDCAQSDPALISQLLRNLLSNAIKYTRQGWVQLRCRHEPARIHLEVLDTGVGIPANELSRIFEEFYQIGVPTNASREGYGLGLSIVRRIADLLGVPVEVQSEPGKGSSFTLSLPVGAAQPSEAAARKGTVGNRADAARGARAVLLIEDDPAVRRATQMLLKVSGYVTIAAADAEEALAQAIEHPEIVALVADYHLPRGETGLNVIDAVGERLGRRIPAVLVTGDTSSAIQRVAQDAHLRIASKPINADELLAMLQELQALPTA
jgi:PAS domain S-box-containing protein